MGGVGACSAPAPPTSTSSPPTPTPPAVAVTARATVVIKAGQPRPPLSDVTAIEVDPPFLRVRPGESVQLRARAVSLVRQEVSGVSFQWASEDLEAGTITQDGMFTAGETPGTYPGALSVVAGAGPQRPSALVTVVVEGAVEPRPLASVHVLPSPVVALQGQVVRLQALGLDSKGVALLGIRFSWSVASPALGVMDPSGVLKVAAGPGTYEGAVLVEAHYGDAAFRTKVSLEVVEALPVEEVLNVQILPNLVRLEPGGTFDFRVVALDGAGQPLVDVEVDWQIVAPAAGSVEATGRFRAGAVAGVFTDAIQVEVTRRSQERTLTRRAFATVLVEPKETRTLASVVLSPKTAVLLPGQTMVFSVRAVDQTGRVVPEAQFSWRVSDQAAGEVTEQGAFTASGRAGVYPGALEVRVEREGVVRTAIADLTIVGTLAQVAIIPPVVDLAPGQTWTLSAVGLDENQVVVPGLVYEWKVLDPRAGAIDRLGYFTAGQTPGVYEGAIQVRVVQRLP